MGLSAWVFTLAASLIALAGFALVLRWTRFRRDSGSACACHGGSGSACRGKRNCGPVPGQMVQKQTEGQKGAV